MTTITWDETLSVKIESIDLQHKKLVDLINSFYQNINLGSKKEKMLELITALKNYTVFHFSTEEKYMKEFKFAGYDNHKLEHDKFIEKVLDFEERYKNDKLLLSIEITNFIKNWITTHIMGTDKYYSDLLLENGIK